MHVLKQGKASQETMFKVRSKIPGAMSGMASTKTFAVFDSQTDIVLLLRKNSTDIIQLCGITDQTSCNAVWLTIDCIVPHEKDREHKNIKCSRLYCKSKCSFLATMLESLGYYNKDGDLVAHHCNGNCYDHRISNALFLHESVHNAFHATVSRKLVLGYDTFIAAVEKVGCSELLLRYVNNQKEILYRKESDAQMQDRVIREFCGSIKAYEQICKSLLQITETQIEKEIQFFIPKPPEN